jgi:hypothetical protein
VKALFFGVALIVLGCGANEAEVCERFRECSSFPQSFSSKQDCEDDVSNADDLGDCLECVEKTECATRVTACAEVCGLVDK